MPAFHVPTDGKPVRVVLFRRKASGPWWFRFWRHGRQVCRSTECTQERDARAAARQVVTDGAAPLDGLLFKQLVQDYLDTRWPEETRRENGKEFQPTYYDHQLRLGYFRDWLEEKEPTARITALPPVQVSRLVQRWLDHRKKADKAASGTLDNDCKAVHRFFEYLRKRRVAWDWNPASKRHLDLAPVQRQPHKDVTYDELTKLLKHGPRHPQVWPMVLLWVGAGLRPRGSGLRVTWADVALGEWPAVKSYEKGKERTVALPGWCAEELRQHLKKYPAQPTDRIWPMPLNALWRHARYLCNDALLGKHVTPQALRRLHSTLCFEAGMTPSEESRRADHSTRVAEKSYVQWKTLRDRGTLGNLDGLLRNLAAKPQQKPQHSGESKTGTK